MATTLASLIDSARYDLVDYSEGILFSDDELLIYLNRMFEIMDSTLAALDSDLTKDIETDIDTVEDQAYVDLSSDLNSGLWSTVTEVWLGETKLTKISLNSLWRKAKFISSSEKPTFWSLHNRLIRFPGDCDDAYTDLIIQYHKKTGVLASTADMPYNDIFNEFFREQLVLHSKMKRLGPQSVQGDSSWNAAFKRVAMAEVIARGFIPLPYNKDF
jgi:hypothetical protein